MHAAQTRLLAMARSAESSQSSSRQSSTTTDSSTHHSNYNTATSSTRTTPVSRTKKKKKSPTAPSLLEASVQPVRSRRRRHRSMPKRLLQQHRSTMSNSHSHHHQPLIFQSPRCVLSDQDVFPQQLQLSGAGASSNDRRWDYVSEQAGSHQQDGTVLRVHRRLMATPVALKFGMPKAAAARVQTLYLPNLYSSDQTTTTTTTRTPQLEKDQENDDEDDLSSSSAQPPEDPVAEKVDGILPAWLDVIVSTFVNLKHLYIGEENKSNNALGTTTSTAYNSNDDRAAALQSRRIYILYRLPNLESINGVPVTVDERQLARPTQAHGQKVQPHHNVKTTTTLMDDHTIASALAVEVSLSDGMPVTSSSSLTEPPPLDEQPHILSADRYDWFQTSSESLQDYHVRSAAAVEVSLSGSIQLVENRTGSTTGNSPQHQLPARDNNTSCFKEPYRPNNNNNSAQKHPKLANKHNNYSQNPKLPSNSNNNNNNPKLDHKDKQQQRPRHLHTRTCDSHDTLDLLQDRFEYVSVESSTYLHNNICDWSAACGSLTIPYLPRRLTLLRGTQQPPPPPHPAAVVVVRKQRADDTHNNHTNRNQKQQQQQQHDGGSNHDKTVAAYDKTVAVYEKAVASSSSLSQSGLVTKHSLDAIELARNISEPLGPPFIIMDQQATSTSEPGGVDLFPPEDDDGDENNGVEVTTSPPPKHQQQMMPRDSPTMSEHVNISGGSSDSASDFDGSSDFSMDPCITPKTESLSPQKSRILASESLTSPFPMQFRARAARLGALTVVTTKLKTNKNNQRNDDDGSSSHSAPSPPPPPRSLHKTDSAWFVDRNDTKDSSVTATIATTRQATIPLQFAERKNNNAKTAPADDNNSNISKPSPLPNSNNNNNSSNKPPPCPSSRPTALLPPTRPRKKKDFSRWRQKQTARKTSIMDDADEEDDDDHEHGISDEENAVA